MCISAGQYLREINANKRAKEIFKRWDKKRGLKKCHRMARTPFSRSLIHAAAAPTGSPYSEQSKPEFFFFLLLECLCFPSLPSVCQRALCIVKASSFFWGAVFFCKSPTLSYSGKGKRSYWHFPTSIAGFGGVQISAARTKFLLKNSCARVHKTEKDRY